MINLSVVVADDSFKCIFASCMHISSSAHTKVMNSRRIEIEQGSLCVWAQPMSDDIKM